mmetsp:Transcript_35002/g.88806  ORF Transcript_35002/g.88806 Transcript_35002/m.88806 type:complete len:230 (+) Transcript_35002:223-912(+)
MARSGSSLRPAYSYTQRSRLYGAPRLIRSRKEGRDLLKLGEGEPLASHLHGPPLEGLLDRVRKPPRVVRQHRRRLLIERVVCVGLEHQELQAHDHALYCEHGLPVLAQDVEADVPLHVDVRVEDRRLALHLRRVVRVGLRHLEVEHEHAPLIHAIVRRHGDLEVHQVLGSVVQIQRHALVHLQLTHVLLHANQPRRDLGVGGGTSRRLLGLLLLEAEQLDHVWHENLRV